MWLTWKINSHYGGVCIVVMVLLVSGVINSDVCFNDVWQLDYCVTVTNTHIHTRSHVFFNLL